MYSVCKATTASATVPFMMRNTKVCTYMYSIGTMGSVCAVQGVFVYQVLFLCEGGKLRDCRGNNKLSLLALSILLTRSVSFVLALPLSLFSLIATKFPLQ